MLVSICGSQGSGKSTLLQAIEDAGYPVVQRKTSRSILSEWNVTLDQINSDPELCIKFQETITARKYNDESEAINSKEIWFTERTHTDLFVYALMNLGKYDQHSNWINRYYNLCTHMNEHYHQVFYIPGGQFNIVQDGVRGSNFYYGQMVDVTMKHFISVMTPLTKPVKYINMVDVKDRLDFVLRNLD